MKKALTVLAIALLMVSCAALGVDKSKALDRAVVNKALDKTLYIPVEFPNPFSEVEMKGHCGQVMQVTELLGMVIFFPCDASQNYIEGTPVYSLVFDTYSMDLVAAGMIYTGEDGNDVFRYWIYRDLIHPTPCTDQELNDWLNGYDHRMSS